MSSNPLVSLHQVGKTFSTVRAVNSVSFRVCRGEIFALLGPNGAGKSTLVRMLIGMLEPDEGSIVWHDPTGRPIPLQRSQIGYLPEDRGLYKSEPTRRILAYFGELHGLAPREALRAADEWLERLEMTQHAKNKLETLSKGNQQKIQIAAALLHRPALAVLDEPFSGLDPLNQELMLELISELRRSGTTILLSAHQLNLVERMADNVLLMSQGSEVLSGTVETIKAGPFGGRCFELEYNQTPDPSLLSQWRRLPEVHQIESISSRRLRMLIDSSSSITEWTSRIAQAGEITNLSCSPLSLHEIYLRALRKSPETALTPSLLEGTLA